MTEHTERAVAPAGAGSGSPASVPLHVCFRQKRLAAGVSQQELAARAGVRQSAVSSFERRGEAAHALSAENIRQIADVLGVEVDASQLAARPRVPRLALFYCPNSECLSAIAYPVGARTFYRPRLLRAEAEQDLRCPDCGEICESCCPECKTELPERPRGAVCPECGTAYIEGDDLSAADLQRRLEWQGLLSAAAEITEYRHVGRPAGSV